MDAQKYRDRLRILLIIYFFSEPFYDNSHPNRIKVLKSEVKIQKIDFWIRYPCHLCYQLLNLIDKGEANTNERIYIKNIVRNVFKEKEPQLRTDEMERFFFGAYEELDDVIAFLKSISLIEFVSSKDSNLNKTIHKEYFLTRYGDMKIKNGLKHVPSINWYSERCKLIHNFFGHLSGSDMKNLQYDIDEYRNTQWNKKIEDIEIPVRNLFKTIFNETI